MKTLPTTGTTNSQLVEKGFSNTPRLPLPQAVVWLITWGRRTSREQCCQRSGAANLPHENTMDVIMARDASTDSVAANVNSAANNLPV